MKYVITYISEKDSEKITNLYCQPDDNYSLAPNELEIKKDIFNYLVELIKIPDCKIHFKKQINTIDDIKYEIPKYSSVTFKYLISFVETENYRMLGGLNVIESTNAHDRKTFIETTEEIYNILKSRILEMQSGKVKTKNTNNFINNINDIIFEFGELKSEDKFELEKVMLIRQMYNSLFTHLDEKVIYNFFNFTMRNNELMSHNIFICDENREDVYLKILQEADNEDEKIKKQAEKKIDILSDYLESYDALREHFKIYEIFKKFEEEIYECETKEELEKTYKLYNAKL